MPLAGSQKPCVTPPNAGVRERKCQRQEPASGLGGAGRRHSGDMPPPLCGTTDDVWVGPERFGGAWGGRWASVLSHSQTHLAHFRVALSDLRHAEAPSGSLSSTSAQCSWGFAGWSARFSGRVVRRVEGHPVGGASCGSRRRMLRYSLRAARAFCSAWNLGMAAMRSSRANWSSTDCAASR